MLDAFLGPDASMPLHWLWASAACFAFGHPGLALKFSTISVLSAWYRRLARVPNAPAARRQRAQSHSGAVLQ